MSSSSVGVRVCPHRYKVSINKDRNRGFDITEDGLVEEFGKGGSISSVIIHCPPSFNEVS